MTDPTPKRRWFYPTPSWLVLGLLVVECLLWLSERFQWFAFNHHKGWTVLIAVAAVGVAVIVTLLWWVASLLLHWRFQFGIRSLLAFCLATSIAVSWLAVERERAQRQREVVEWIRSLHATVEYDWEVYANHINNPLAHAAPTGPGWQRKMLGDDFFSEVFFVGIAGITDAGVEHLKGLTQLQSLDLYGCAQMTDAGLEHLKGLTNLGWLRLTGTKVTDAGVKELQKALPECKFLR